MIIPPKVTSGKSIFREDS